MDWLTALEEAAKEHARRWGHDLTPGDQLPGDDASRAVLRDGFRRLAHDAGGILVALRMWHGLEPRPDDPVCTCRLGSRFDGPRHAKTCPRWRAIVYSDGA